MLSILSKSMLFTTITTDGGSVFISEEFKKFTTEVGIKLIRSSPYYA
jgi:hypothetical protein